MRVGGEAPTYTERLSALVCVSMLTWVTFFHRLLWNRGSPWVVFLFSEAQPGFRKGELCLEAMFPLSMMLALPHEVPTVGWALGFPTQHGGHGLYCEWAEAVLPSLFAMKTMGKKLIFVLFKRYVTLLLFLFIVKRWGGPHMVQGSAFVMACKQRWDEGFMESVISSSLFMGSGDWNLPIKPTQHQGLLSTMPSRWPHHFHFCISWVSDLEVSWIVFIWTHSPYSPHFPLDSRRMTSSTSVASLSTICSFFCKFYFMLFPGDPSFLEFLLATGVKHAIHLLSPVLNSPIVPTKPFLDSAPSLRVTAVFLISHAQHQPMRFFGCLYRSQEAPLASLDTSLHPSLPHSLTATSSHACVFISPLYLFCFISCLQPICWKF